VKSDLLSWLSAYHLSPPVTRSSLSTFEWCSPVGLSFPPFLRVGTWHYQWHPSHHGAWFPCGKHRSPYLPIESQSMVSPRSVLGYSMPILHGCVFQIAEKCCPPPDTAPSPIKSP
jgi:hypothetical protein